MKSNELQHSGTHHTKTNEQLERTRISNREKRQHCRHIHKSTGIPIFVIAIHYIRTFPGFVLNFVTVTPHRVFGSDDFPNTFPILFVKSPKNNLQQFQTIQFQSRLGRLNSTPKEREREKRNDHHLY